MTEQTLKTYKSRRNQARLVLSGAGRYVVKTFAEAEGFRRELRIYHLLRDQGIPCAEVLAAYDNTLLLTELPGQNLVDCLQEQEQQGMLRRDVWEKLADWLIDFHNRTGYVITDTNLRNFLYDAKTGKLYGLDFEECSKSSILLTAAGVTAYIRTYHPENTPLKLEISQLVLDRFAQRCSLAPDILFRESKWQEALLLERRKNRI